MRPVDIKTEKSKTAIDCKVCGKELFVNKSRLNRTSYCSNKCRFEGQRIFQKKEKVKKLCERCGVQYESKTFESRKQKYCSQKCHNDSKSLQVFTDDGKKICLRCKEPLPVDSFHINKRNSTGRDAVCKKCFGERNRESKIKLKNENPQEYAKRQLINRLKKYRLSVDDYSNLIEKQSGCCAICDERMDIPFIDHCHTSGTVRGLLCAHCNTGLGMFKDRPERLSSAIRYLQNIK